MFRIFTVVGSQNQLRIIDVSSVTLNRVAYIINTNNQGEIWHLFYRVLHHTAS